MIAVTGGSGHVGANLVRQLLARGEKVRALVCDDARGLAGLAVEKVRGDLADRAALRRLLEGCDLLYHLAAKIAIGGESWDFVAATNVEGVRNVTAAAREAGVRRMVHFSSIHAIEPRPLDGTVDETRPLRDGLRGPRYDRSKAAGERVLRDAIDRGLDAVVVCPTAVLGPHDFKPSRMGRVLLALRGRRLPGLVDGGFNWVDARDVAAGAITAAERGKTGERFLLSGEWRSMTELAATVEEVTRARPPRFVSPMWLARVGAPFALWTAQALGQPVLFSPAALNALREHRYISHDKATRLLDYHPRPLRDTVADTFAWFDASGVRV